jgi:hypothetical protein
MDTAVAQCHYSCHPHSAETPVLCQLLVHISIIFYSQPHYRLVIAAVCIYKRIVLVCCALLTRVHCVLGNAHLDGVVAAPEAAHVDKRQRAGKML